MYYHGTNFLDTKNDQKDHLQPEIKFSFSDYSFTRENKIILTKLYISILET